MAITRLNFNTLADGGDDATGAFQKLDANDADLDVRIAATSAALAALGNAAAKNVGTIPGSVAAGDDVRFLNRGRRNLLMNGGLRVNQRVFAGGAMVANTYGYDRWRTFGAASSFTLSADLTTITLNGTVGQVIEAPAAGGGTVTVSVSNPSGQITVNLRPDATTAGVNGIIPGGAGIQSVTLVVPASLTGNVFFQLTTAAAVTMDGPVKRGGIQLEYGSFASAFEAEPFGETIRACQRYYEKSFPYSTAAASQQAASFYTGASISATGVRVGPIAFKVTKRAIPTVVLYSANVSAGAPAGSWSIFYSTGSWSPSNTTGTVSLTDAGMAIDINFAGGLAWGQGVTATGNWTADADF